MIRRRTNFAGGVLDASIDDTDTVLESASFADLPVITDPEYLAITIDPEGTPEIVWVLEHTIGDDEVTVERGKEDTTAISHASSIPWVHAPTTKDFTTIVNTDDLDSIIYVGTVDPEDNYTPVEGDIWFDTSGA